MSVDGLRKQFQKERGGLSERDRLLADNCDGASLKDEGMEGRGGLHVSRREKRDRDARRRERERKWKESQEGRGG